MFIVQNNRSSDPALHVWQDVLYTAAQRNRKLTCYEAVLSIYLEFAVVYTGFYQ